MTNINKTIHEAMGLCWHENVAADKEKTPGWFYCIDCGVFVGDTLPIPLSDFPDYTAPVHYCALMDWIKYTTITSTKIELFTFWLMEKYNYSHRFYALEFFCRSTRQEQITLIAEAIEAGVLK